MVFRFLEGALTCSGHVYAHDDRQWSPVRWGMINARPLTGLKEEFHFLSGFAVTPANKKCAFEGTSYVIAGSASNPKIIFQHMLQSSMWLLERLLR